MNKTGEAVSKRDMHPLVLATKLFSGGKWERSLDPSTLNVRVSSQSQDRAYRFLCNLLYACERRGFSAVAGGADARLLINGEAVRFSLEERGRKVVVPTSERKHAWSPQFILEPTGRLALLSLEWAEGTKKAWSDGANSTLEDQLDGMILGFIRISEIVRHRRLERESVERLWEEKRKQQQVDAHRQEQLRRDLDSWKRAKELRAFVASTQEAFSQDPALDAWQDWVRKLASKHDPVSDGASKFFDRYRITSKLS